VTKFYSFQIIVWNCEPDAPNQNNILNIIDCHVDMIYSLAINRDGSLIATTSKDKKLRVIEPRNGIVVSEGTCHNGTKCSKVVFLNNDKVLTTGFSKHSDRQYAIWNQHDLKKPLVQEVIDSSSGIVQPFFDFDTKVLYLAGKGDGNIRYYEIVDEAPYIYYLNQFLSGYPQKALGAMPKRGMNVSNCEVFRFYKLHATGNICEPISMIVPRKSNLFQSDLYPDTLSLTPAISLKDWQLGRNIQPVLMSLQTGQTVLDVTNKKLTCNGVKKVEQKNNGLDVNDEKHKLLERQKSIDNNSKKFAFLAEQTIPDYRTQPDKTQDKLQKTTTNQTTKFHQLQLIFGQQHPTNNTKEFNNIQNNSLILQNSNNSSNNNSTENINLIHTENEVRISY
jgi:coronin-2